MPSPRDLAAAEAVLAQQSGVLFAALADCDLLLCATLPLLAPAIGADQVSIDGHTMHVERALTRLTSMADVTGLPALSLPVAGGRRPPLPVTPSADGELPAGVQLVGRPRDEMTVLRAGYALEAALREDGR